MLLLFQVIRNVTSSKPTFYVKNLKPGTRFEARVYTSNQKGRSDEVFVMRASTLKRASDKRPVTSLASGAGKFSHHRVIDFPIVIMRIELFRWKVLKMILCIIYTWMQVHYRQTITILQKLFHKCTNKNATLCIGLSNGNGRSDKLYISYCTKAKWAGACWHTFRSANAVCSYFKTLTLFG